MSAGRLQLWDKRASLRDRASRLLVRLDGDRELRLREFGTQQRAWGKLLPADAVAVTMRWPPRARCSARAGGGRVREPARSAPPPPSAAARPARDRRHRALLVDELLWTARLSPFQKGSDLDEDAIEHLRLACQEVLARRSTLRKGHWHHDPGQAADAASGASALGRAVPALWHEDRGDPLQGLLMCYCPEEQTGGRVLKDRRLSRLLK